MIWFSSDHHFYHSNVIRYCSRPYRSIEEMNADLVQKWNEVVMPEDTVYYLGDFALAHRAVEVYTPLLNGTKHLIMGNHDFPHPAHPRGRKQGVKWKQLYLDYGWNSVELTKTMEIGGELVHLNHLPYTASHPRAKYNMYESPETRPLICGHVHEKWKIKISGNKYLMYNVGVDVHNMYPVSIDTVAKELLNGVEVS